MDVKAAIGWALVLGSAGCVGGPPRHFRQLEAFIEAAAADATPAADVTPPDAALAGGADADRDAFDVDSDGGFDANVQPVARCPRVDPGCDGRALDEQDDCELRDRVLNGCAPDEAGLGQCERGVIRCVSLVDFVCEALEPEPERCDNVDNDCDGEVDEGCSGPRLGACADGEPPRPEVCDGIDNDCEGATDELGPCRTGLPGICARGTWVCGAESPAGAVCEPVTRPGTQEERCNGFDDDCDGEIDERPAGEPVCGVPG